MPFHLNDGGTWKEPEFWLNDQGTWKRPEVWVNDQGTWRLVATPVVITVAISPYFLSGGGSDQLYFFPQTTATATGGTPTNYSWGFVSQTGGNWFVNSGQGTAAAQFGVNNVFETAFAIIYCDLTVNGQVYRATAELTYNRTGDLVVAP